MPKLLLHTKIILMTWCYYAQYVSDDIDVNLTNTLTKFYFCSIEQNK